MSKHLYSVLLVDDSPDDRLFMRRAIEASPSLILEAELDDGEAVIDYLSAQGRYQSRANLPLPDVLLLDLKLPRKTGHEVLEWLQKQSFSNLFVAVVSGSFLAEDISRSLELGAQAYFKKRPGREELVAIVKAITTLLEHDPARETGGSAGSGNPGN